MNLDSFRLHLAGESVVSLSANHLQKLRLSFQLATPQGHGFKPHQVCNFVLPFRPCCLTVFDKFVCLQAFLKLRHESGVEHVFVVGGSGKQFEIILVKFVQIVFLPVFMKHAANLQLF